MLFTQEPKIPRRPRSCLVTPAFPKPLGAADRTRTPCTPGPGARVRSGSQVPKGRGHSPRQPPRCILPAESPWETQEVLTQASPGPRRFPTARRQVETRAEINNSGRGVRSSPTHGLACVSPRSWWAEARAQRSASRVLGPAGPSSDLLGWRDAVLSGSLEMGFCLSLSL